MDAVKGTHRELSYIAATECSTCSGKGGTGVKTCTSCHGKGFVMLTSTLKVVNFIRLLIVVEYLCFNNLVEHVVGKEPYLKENVENAMVKADEMRNDI